MKTLSSNKWKFAGVLEGNLCFVSKIHDDERSLCGAACKLVDVTTGNVAILTLRQGCRVEAEWTYASMRKAEANSISLPDNSKILECIR